MKILDSDIGDFNEKNINVDELIGQSKNGSSLTDSEIMDALGEGADLEQVDLYEALETIDEDGCPFS